MRTLALQGRVAGLGGAEASVRLDLFEKLWSQSKSPQKLDTILRS